MGRRVARLVMVLSGVVTLCLASWAPATQQSDLDQEFKTKVQPLLKKHCVSCHSGSTPAAGLALDKSISLKAVTEKRSLWQRLVYNVNSRTMPPKGQLDDVERRTITDWFEKAIVSDCRFADAGHVTLRRLNKLQYQNTVRDLLGVEAVVANDFPSDDVGNGFDNIGDVLTVSPLLLEKYVASAEAIAKAAIKVPSAIDIQIESGTMTTTEGVKMTLDGELGFFAQGLASQAILIDQPGTYTLQITAWAQQAGPEVAKIRLGWDQKTIGVFPVNSIDSKHVELQFPLTITAGTHHLAMSFANDFYDPKNPDPAQRDRNLYVSQIRLIKPESKVTLPNGPITALPKDDHDLETPGRILTNFMGRAYRRPATQSESARILKLYSGLRANGEKFEAAMQICVEAILTSPHFLFRVEAATNGSADRNLSNTELATRLSYFLWGSLPDEELRNEANQSKLTEIGSRAKQVERMLLSEKSRNLATDFAMQWLQLRKLANSSPDPKLFPAFDENLRRDMLSEVEALFMDALRQNKSVLDLVQSDTVFVNERLAKFYGLQAVTGPNLRAVKLSQSERGGLLGTAAFLTVTSNPNRTSPVKRGKWILEQILGTPPPSPPPNVGALPEDQAIKPTLPMKERLALHRKNPACSNCHKAMDALGFSLERYDPIGRIREKDGDITIDSKGELPDGTSVDGILDLKKLVMGRKKDFVRCLAERLLTYAIGRGLRPEDTCHVDKIVQQSEKDDYRFHTLIQAIVASDPFCKVSPVRLIK